MKPKILKHKILLNLIIFHSYLTEAVQRQNDFMYEPYFNFYSQFKKIISILKISRYYPIG